MLFLIREHSGDHLRLNHPTNTYSPPSSVSKPSSYKMPPMSSVAFLNFKHGPSPSNKQKLPHWVTRDIVPHIRVPGRVSSTSKPTDETTSTEVTHQSPPSAEPAKEDTNNLEEDVSLVQLLEEALDFLEDYPQYIDELDLDALYDYLTNETEARNAQKATDEGSDREALGISTSHRPPPDELNEDVVVAETTTFPNEIISNDEPKNVLVSTESVRENAVFEQPGQPDAMSFRPVELPRLEDLFGMQTSAPRDGEQDGGRDGNESAQPEEAGGRNFTFEQSNPTATTEPIMVSQSTTSTMATPTRTVANNPEDPTGWQSVDDAVTKGPTKYNPLRSTRAPNVAVLIQSAKSPEEIRKLVESYTNPKKKLAASSGQEGEIKSVVEDPPKEKEDARQVEGMSGAVRWRPAAAITTATTEKPKTEPPPVSTTTSATPNEQTSSAGGKFHRKLRDN